ncbi:MAG: hypothetical protein V4773_28140 [Verrucomicrobiota bacterium]
MLGTSVNIDPLTLGSIIGSIILTVLGLKAGDLLKGFRPPASADPVASGVAAVFADKELQTRQTMALESIASTIKEYLRVQTDENERRTKELLDIITSREEQDRHRRWQERQRSGEDDEPPAPSRGRRRPDHT